MTVYGVLRGMGHVDKEGKALWGMHVGAIAVEWGSGRCRRGGVVFVGGLHRDGYVWIE